MGNCPFSAVFIVNMIGELRLSKNSNTSGSNLAKTKPKKHECSEEWYPTVHRDCVSGFIGEIKTPMNVSLKQHQTAIRKTETLKYGLA